MPRQRRSTAARSAILSAPSRRVMLASATNYRKTPIKSTAVATGTVNSSVKNPPKITAQDWQTTAWTYYDSIGEYRYACDWVGNLLSRVKLVVYKNGEPTTDADAVDALDALFDGPEGQADMLRQLGKHWTVAGDCFIIGDNVSEDPTSDDPNGSNPPDWLIGAATQVTQNNDGLWKVNTETFAKNALVIRLWKPHPTDRTTSDSPSRAVLPILSEIDGLTKYVAAQVDSRLAGNGLLLIPDNITFGSATPEAPADQDSDDPPAVRRDAQEFVETLIQVASTAIADREDPNSLIPVVLQADGEALQYVRHVSLSTDLQTEAQSLRTEAIRRLALGMDMPPEILTGTSDMNHWSSWQIEEAAIKSHLEPLLDEICSSLTRGYLQPLLESNGDDVYTIEADTTAIRLRPNRSKEALELYNIGELSGETLRRENGFEENDKMADDEFIRWMEVKIAGGSASPEQVQAALEALGVNLRLAAPAGSPDPASTDPEKDPNATRETRPTPTTKEHPVQAPPDTKNPGTQDAPTPDSAASVDDRVVMAGAMMVDRALERAGNRIKGKLDAKIRDAGGSLVPAAQIYRFVKVDASSSTLDDLLTDAWEPCARWSRELGVDPVWLTRSLDNYTRGVLQHARPHTAPALRAHLALESRF